MCRSCGHWWAENVGCTLEESEQIWREMSRDKQNGDDAVNFYDPAADAPPDAAALRAELALVRECIPEALTDDDLRELRAREARLASLLGDDHE
jgi:hypothetical protein